MSEMEPEPAAVRQQPIAAEVLELGQMLFDAVIEAASRSGPENAPSEPFPAEDVRAAADEFFRALRVLLGVGDA